MNHLTMTTQTWTLTTYDMTDGTKEFVQSEHRLIRELYMIIMNKGSLVLLSRYYIDLLTQDKYVSAKNKQAHVTQVGFLLWLKGRILENPVVVVDDGHYITSSFVD